MRGGGAATKQPGSADLAELRQETVINIIV